MSPLMWYTPTHSKGKTVFRKPNVAHPSFSYLMEPIVSRPDEAKGERILDSAACIPTLFSISDLETLYRFCLDVALDLVYAEKGSIFLWDEFQKQFVLKASRGHVHPLGDIRVDLGQGILGWIGDHADPVWVEDIREDERFQSLRTDGRYRSFSFISLPLVASNKLIGVINITERQNLLAFGHSDFLHLRKFADQAAVACDNLRKMHGLRRDNEELHHTLNQLKQKFAEIEPLTAIGKLATHLAHELNNPLDAIRRYVNLGLDQAMEDSLTREYLLKAKKGIRRAIQVIRGLLHFSRGMHHASGQVVEIHGIIEQSLEALAEDPAFRSIKIEKLFCASSTYVLDRGLPIVLQNLYRNAQEAMKGEGTLKVSTERMNGSVRVLVQDTGVGISELQAKQLFQPFFTTKDQGNGTGIGLTLSREIVERSGGKISLDRVENGILDSRQGARFVITLPVQPSLESLS